MSGAYLPNFELAYDFLRDGGHLRDGVICVSIYASALQVKYACSLL